MIVGDKCRVLKDIVQLADDYSPTHMLAARDDVLEVRQHGGEFYDYYVAHPAMEPKAMFGVNANEIERIP